MIVVHLALHMCKELCLQLQDHYYAGVYEIVDRGGRKTSFAYKLEIPQELGEVQQELQIKKEASYTLSMKVR